VASTIVLIGYFGIPALFLQLRVLATIEEFLKVFGGEGIYQKM